MTRSLKPLSEQVIAAAAVLGGGALAWSLLRGSKDEAVAMPAQAGDMAQIAPESEMRVPVLVDA